MGHHCRVNVWQIFRQCKLILVNRRERLGVPVLLLVVENSDGISLNSIPARLFGKRTSRNSYMISLILAELLKVSTFRKGNIASGRLRYG